MKEINFEHIDLYIKNQLDGQALNDFNERLKVDIDFSTTVENYKLAAEASKIAGRNMLKDELRTIHQDVIVKRKSWRKVLIRSAAIVSVLILAALGVYLLNDEKGNSVNDTTEKPVESFESKILPDHETDNNLTDNGNTSGTGQKKITPVEDNIKSHPHQNEETTHTPLNPVNENPSNGSGTYPVQDDLTKQNNSVKGSNTSDDRTFRSSNPNASFASDKTDGCTPLTVKFVQESSVDKGIITNYYWDFGDGNHSSQPDPVHTYTKSGIYHVRLKIWTEDGQSDEIVRNSYIKSNLVPEVEFEIVPNVAIKSSTVYFKNNSTQLTPGTQFTWDFGDGLGVSNEKEPDYQYNIAGTYQVKLSAENEYGCIDNASRKVNVISDIALYVPNSFTPNGDGQNDTFKLSASGITDFYFAITNKKGEIIYESTDYITHGWDGTIRGQHVSVIPQVFVYIVKVTGLNGRKLEKKGTITLLK